MRHLCSTCIGITNDSLLCDECLKEIIVEEFNSDLDPSTQNDGDVILSGADFRALLDRISALEAAASNLIRCWGNLAIRNEASMAVWRDKLSEDMILGMNEDRTAGWVAVKRLRALGL